MSSILALCSWASKVKSELADSDKSRCRNTLNQLNSWALALVYLFLLYGMTNSWYVFQSITDIGREMLMIMLTGLELSETGACREHRGSASCRCLLLWPLPLLLSVTESSAPQFNSARQASCKNHLRPPWTTWINMKGRSNRRVTSKYHVFQKKNKILPLFSRYNIKSVHDHRTFAKLFSWRCPANLSKLGPT